MKRYRWKLAAAASLWLVACSEGSSVTGTYVQKSDTGAAMLQLVQQPGGQVNGQFTGVFVDGLGQLRESSAPVTGTFSGAVVTLQLHDRTTLDTPHSLTGAIQTGGLELNGGTQNGVLETFSLARADVSAFQSAAAAVRERGAVIARQQQAAAAEQQQREIADQEATRSLAVIGETSKVAAAMDAFAQRVDGHKGDLSKVRDRLELINGKAEDLVAAFRAKGISAAAGERFTLVSKLEVAVTLTNQVKGEVLAEDMSVSFDQSQLATRAAPVLEQCAKGLQDGNMLAQVCTNVNAANNRFLAAGAAWTAWNSEIGTAIEQEQQHIEALKRQMSGLGQ